MTACGAAWLLGGLAIAAPAGADELPAPFTPITYYSVPSVSIEVHGSYSERFAASGTGDEEKIEYKFDLARTFSFVEWQSSTSPPSFNSQLTVEEQAGREHFEASGTLELVNGSGPLKGQVVTCDYAQSSTEPPSPSESDPLFGLVELNPNPEEPGAFAAKFHYPLNPGDVIVTPAGSEDSQCEFVHTVATEGELSHESAYNLATNPLDRVAVDFDNGAAEQIYKIPHTYSASLNGDEVDLAEEEVVKINRLPGLPPPLSEGGPPPPKFGPSTPITNPPPTKEPPRIEEPEVEGKPPVIGGGDPPKLHTGITAKCPKAVKTCTVTGVIEAELPVARHASAARAARGTKVRRVVLGRVTFALTGGAARKVIVALPKSAVAFLRSHPGVRARIAVTVASPGAGKVSRSRTARLRLPARHR